MKAIIQCYTPEEVERIARGAQTIKVGKTAPKEVPFKVYMYQTKKRWIYKLLPWLKKRQAKVIGEFICDKVDFVEYKDECYVINDDIAYTNTIASKSCLDYDDMYKYLGDKNGYGLHISDLKIYDKPKDLSEFGIARAPQSWIYVETV